jgi:hypothetical protein
MQFHSYIEQLFETKLAEYESVINSPLNKQELSDFSTQSEGEGCPVEYFSNAYEIILFFAPCGAGKKMTSPQSPLEEVRLLLSGLQPPRSIDLEHSQSRGE